jgi:hypothetical protein
MKATTTVTISFPSATLARAKQAAGRRNLSRFVVAAVEKKLSQNAKSHPPKTTV